MKRNCPLICYFHFLGPSKVALCLETTPAKFTESFACVGTRYYLRELNRDVPAGGAVREDQGCGERSRAKDYAHLRQVHRSEQHRDGRYNSPSKDSFVMTFRKVFSFIVSYLLCSSLTGTQLPKCPKQKQYLHFYTTWR